MSALTPTSVYLVDSKPGRSASAVAINNCVRSVIGAITTIISSNCVNALGTGVMFTILAAVNTVNIITALLVMTYGRNWRANFEQRTGAGPAVNNEKWPVSEASRQEQNNDDRTDHRTLVLVNSKRDTV